MSEAMMTAEDQTDATKPNAGRPKVKKEQRAKGQAAELVALARRITCFRSPTGEPIATVPAGDHRETWPIRSKNFRHRLTHAFYVRHGKPPAAQAVQDALGILEATAIFGGPELPVFTRVGERDGVYYLDLANERWEAVAITGDGWQVVGDAPPFRRARALSPLPTPARGGRVDELRDFVNVPDGEDWRLLLAWLVQALRPRGPYPILCFQGEQGSAKSTTARVVRSLVDPNGAPLRSEPREARDLMIMATNAWTVSFDNLSHLPPWLSDALCRLATGGGFSIRELYSNDEEQIFDAMRPVILTSIEDLATRGDLLERSLLLNLPTIPESRRRTEEDHWRAFEEARPRILGALLDVVSAAMRNLPSVRLDGLPRMADFAKWVAAAESALGWERGAFLQAYRGNVKAANDLALEDSPVVAPLRQLIEHGPWPPGAEGGTCAALLEALTRQAGAKASGAKGWPRSPRGLSSQLRRLAPNLRRAGVEIAFGRRPGGNRERWLSVRAAQTGEENVRPDRPHSGQKPAPTEQSAQERDGRHPELNGFASHARDVCVPPGTEWDGWDGQPPSSSDPSNDGEGGGP
jgi:hypothetical protein